MLNLADAQTTLSFSLPAAANVSVEVVNTLQQVVATPASNQAFNMGTNSLMIPTATLANGIYTVHISAVTQQGAIYRTSVQLLIMR